MKYKAQDYQTFQGARLVPVKVFPKKSGQVVPNWQVVAQWTDGTRVGLEMALRRISSVNSPAEGELPPGSYYLKARMGNQISQRQYAIIGGTKEYDCDLPLP